MYFMIRSMLSYPVEIIVRTNTPYYVFLRQFLCVLRAKFRTEEVSDWYIGTRPINCRVYHYR